MKSITVIALGFANVANSIMFYILATKIYLLAIFLATTFLADKNGIDSIEFGVEKFKGTMTGSRKLGYKNALESIVT